MSAAATAAGYLYASGRLRGRAAREQAQRGEKTQQIQPVSTEDLDAEMPARDEPKPKRTPRIEYRTRKRWSPE
jgi:hypothetical protein